MDKQLPQHGRIQCSKCYSSNRDLEFDESKCAEGDWRITANPLAWGNPSAEIVVLGFSKGPTQAGALASSPHDGIAYKGSRKNVGKILAHIGVLPSSADHAAVVDRAISDKCGRFHFGSLIRCTVERRDSKANVWKGSGGGMLDRFVATPFGQRVARNCTDRFLNNLPARTKLVVMFGMGSNLNYVKASFKLYQYARGGSWRWLNHVSYTDGHVTVVHVEHFASQGNLIPEWLGQATGKRSSYGLMARAAVVISGVSEYDKSTAPTSTAKLATKPKANPTALVKAVAERLEKRPRTTKMEESQRLTEVGQIIDAVLSAGYEEHKNNSKVAGFTSPRGQVIYLLKEQSRPNNIRLAVDPRLSTDKLWGLPGVVGVSADTLGHSNLTLFPKTKKSREEAIHHGRPVRLSTFSDLHKFLVAFGVFE